ncbi:MAG: GNAT family N-acetyltransferase [Promethearchaeota archaeon]
MLEGKRVFLRAIERDDLPKVREWYNDYVMRGVWTGGYNPISAERFEQERFMDTTDDKKRRLSIVLKKTGELIGSVSYQTGDFNSAEIGIVIGEKKFRRGGYGTEAIQLLLKICFLEENFHKLSLWTGGWNISAQKLAESLGFKLAVRIRKGFMRDGEWHDALFYDMLREEYLERYGDD